MADRYLIETSATDGYQTEDGAGVLLLETGPPETSAAAGLATATATATAPGGDVTASTGHATGRSA